MSEFSLIQRFCQNIGWSHSDTVIGVGDDAAVVQIPATMELVISVDTLVEGVHFFTDASPEHIAHKLVAVNISDMAAMGANPRWATLALTLPSLNEAWLTAFSSALDDICKRYKVQLIGGDTCQGKMTISLQIMGLIAKGKALTRSNAQLDDDLYVSSNLGDAALALATLQNSVTLDDVALKRLRIALDTPTPQPKLGQKLLGVAHACIDISDGLLGDLVHIARLSKVSILVDVDRVPLSADYQQYLQQGGSLDYALNGGDDYQLAFTVAKSRRAEVKELARQLGLKLTRIGAIVKTQSESVILQQGNQAYTVDINPSYQHFIS